MNNIHVIGNLTRDPELYQSRDFDACNFAVADNYGENVIYHNIKTFNELANVCAKYLKKGSKVYVCGRLEKTEKDDKVYYNIIANKIEFLSPKTEEDEATKKTTKSSKGGKR